MSWEEAVNASIHNLTQFQKRLSSYNEMEVVLSEGVGRAIVIVIKLYNGVDAPTGAQDKKLAEPSSLIDESVKQKLKTQQN